MTALLRIFGAGALGREVRDAAIDAGLERDEVQMFDDAPSKVASHMKVMPAWMIPAGVGVCVAVADPALRRAISGRLDRPCSFKSPRVYVAETVGMMGGHILLPGACLSSECQIGEGVIIGFNSTIGHDVVLGDFVTISSQVDLCGGVTVGDGVFIGSGARVLPGVTIGAGAYVGAGSVVVKSVEPGARVFGNPAR